MKILKTLLLFLVVSLVYPIASLGQSQAYWEAVGKVVSQKDVHDIGGAVIGCEIALDVRPPTAGIRAYLIDFRVFDKNLCDPIQIGKTFYVRGSVQNVECDFNVCVEGTFLVADTFSQQITSKRSDGHGK